MRAENDDKLITLLKNEVRRLEQGGGAKTASKGGMQPAGEVPDAVKLKAENGRLRN